MAQISATDLWRSPLRPLGISLCINLCSLGVCCVDSSHITCPETCSLPAQLNMTAVLCLTSSLCVMLSNISLLESWTIGFTVWVCLFSETAEPDWPVVYFLKTVSLHILSIFRSVFCWMAHLLQLFHWSWKQKYTRSHFVLQLFMI